ncbi:Protein GREB1 [Manis javanica]|nr:Protein GREB1 [Manis javanica]
MGPRRHEDVPRKGASPRGAPSRGQPRVPPAHLGRARGPGRARRGRATGGTPRHVAGSGVQPIDCSGLLHAGLLHGCRAARLQESRDWSGGSTEDRD